MFSRKKRTKYATLPQKNKRDEPKYADPNSWKAKVISWGLTAVAALAFYSHTTGFNAQAALKQALANSTSLDFSNLTANGNDHQQYESVESAPSLDRRISPLFTPQVRYWEADIIRWADEYDLDPNMIATVMQIESCGDPDALSRAGARGLFQVMPYHFAPGENPFDPDTNARRGLNYLLERLEQTNGDVGRAFAGYNGGHVAAGSSWESWAHETQRYFVWATGIYSEVTQGLETSPTLERWLQAGGASLCGQASRSLGMGTTSESEKQEFVTDRLLTSLFDEHYVKFDGIAYLVARPDHKMELYI